jgi:dTDP-4-amino-4,6-dideoxygalactose transaminase
MRHKLKVIYDAAHAFGVKYHGKSLLNYGDMSVLSFHATKIFNTFEGGAIICHEKKTKQKIDFLKNHGFSDETTIVMPGINAKMNELQAAMGLLQLSNIDQRIAKLQKIAFLYREKLSNVPGLTLLGDIPRVRHNYSYFPVLIDEAGFGVSRDKVYEGLKEKNIFTRRYFYPLISNFPTYKNLPSADKKYLPVAHKTARQVLCLPNYADLNLSEVEDICNYMLSIRNNYREINEHDKVKFQDR